VYVFGDLLDGADPIEWIEIVLVLNLPAEEVPWESHPDGADWLVRELRLDKGGYAFWWRSREDPVWNHHIRGPVRFWSVDGPDEDVLDRALARLRDLHQNYWERDGRREHRGNCRYPENELWEAVDGYLSLLATQESHD
jgi:hypothetical protein